MSIPNPTLVLRVSDLSVSFTSILGESSDAVRDISFNLHRNKTLALVGESGSGKTVTSYSILRLIQPPGKITAGSITFFPKNDVPLDITSLPAKSETLYRLRGGKISMIFQEPMTALSPVHTVGNQICEAILLHRDCTPTDATAKAKEMLEKVGITDPTRRLKQYPFELSGGLRQRIVIAMALVCRPEILIADEPTTALDVTVQAQILTLIRELQKEMNTAVLFITHDLGVVAKIADDVAVMQHGRIIESAPVRDLFQHPYHPYTRRLLASTPHARLDPEIKKRLEKQSAPNDLPQGWQITPQPDTVPRMHTLDNNRSLLLWPKRG